jgi:membrane protease YdiL (CAAX protease family)
MQWVGKGKWRDVVWGIGLWCIAFIVAAALFGAQRLLDIPQEKTRGVQADQLGSVVTLIHVVRIIVLASVVEEVFWRAHIQDRLCASFGSVMGILLQAVVFAGMHFRGPMDAMRLFAFGMILGWGWRCKKTLLPLIVAHALWNLVAMAPFICNELHTTRVARSVSKCGGFLEELCKPADYDPNDNAYYDYVRAIQSLQARPEGLGNAELTAWPGDMCPSTIQLVRAWISSNRQAISELEAGAQKRFHIRNYATMQLEDMVACPFWPQEREILSVALMKARMNAADNALEEAISGIMTCYRFGGQRTGPKPLNEQEFGFAARRASLTVAVQILNRAAVDESVLAAFQAAFATTVSRDAAPVDYSGQQCILSCMVESTFTLRRLGYPYLSQDVRTSLMEDPGCLQYGEEAWRRVHYEMTVKSMHELFDCLRVLAECTPAALRRTGRSAAGMIRQTLHDNPLLLWLTDGYERYYYRLYVSHIWRDGLLLTIAIMRYHLEQGDLPETLDQLVDEGYLAVLPVDPFSDSSYIYRKTEDEFLLYSPGPNGEDDGGIRIFREADWFNGDIVFWPPVVRD